jgi:uncharacterized membrane protein (DUF441 family)
LVTGVLGFTRLAFAIAQVVKFYGHPFLKTFAQIRWLCVLAISLGILQDIITTGGIVYYLQKSKTRFKKTREMLNWIMLLSIESGVLTSLTGISFLVLLTVHPTWWLPPFFIWGKTYSNSFMVTLNTRNYLLSKGSLGGVAGVSETIALADPVGEEAEAWNRRTSIVHIAKTREFQYAHTHDICLDDRIKSSALGSSSSGYAF